MEIGRLLAGARELQSTLEMAAGVALPHFGTWCMVDVVDTLGAIQRVSIIHPDPAKQQAARDYYAVHPPRSDDPLGASRVIRTAKSELLILTADDVIDGVVDVAHREVLRMLDARSFFVVPMRARGRVVGAITFASDRETQYDVTDLLLAEDLGCRCAMAIDNVQLHAEAVAARELSLLTRMSLDFRTPLGIVLGYAGLLKDGAAGSVNDAQRLQLQRIETASQHMLGIIEAVFTDTDSNRGRGPTRP